jgi:hypothetical protein
MPFLPTKVSAVSDSSILNTRIKKIKKNASPEKWFFLSCVTFLLDERYILIKMAEGLKINRAFSIF